MNPVLILVNPWIYDFAAYDLWSKPLGLLYCASWLRECGFTIRLIDCLDVHHPGMNDFPALPLPVRRSYGTGKFPREPVPKPLPLRHIPKTYSRYGIPEQLFISELKQIENPAAILVTSLMTYWYPGVMEVIRLAKEIHPRVPIILGGIYARLCRDHALNYSGADHVVNGVNSNDPDSLVSTLKRFDIHGPVEISDSTVLPFPAFDLLHKLDYACVLTSTGCPYQCQYCASRFLNPEFFQRDAGEVLEEILFWHLNHGIRDIAFYDDALLINLPGHMRIILEKCIELGLDLRFHTPNGLHVREISPECATLLHRSGFRTIRLGLETCDIERHNLLDNKVAEGEFEKAVQNLKKAGFLKNEIGVYVLAGLPGQSADSVAKTIRFVGDLGTTPFLAEYSPLPHTPLWEKALSSSAYDIATEPLFHNNSLLPCWDESLRRRIPELKRLVREIRERGS